MMISQFQPGGASVIFKGGQYLKLLKVLRFLVKPIVFSIL